MKRWNLPDFAGDDSGAVMIYTAVAITAFMGLAGLAVDAGLWYSTSRSVGTTADAGALTAVLELAAGSDEATVRSRVLADVALNGYYGNNGDTVTVNIPPLSGAYAGDNTAAEVIIQQPTPSLFSSVLGQGDVTIVGRAVGKIGQADACVIALNPSDPGTLTVAGGASIELDCGAIANSTDPAAINTDGSNSCLTATSITTAGGHVGTCVDPTVTEYASPVGDPLASLPPPSYSACDEPNPVLLENDTSGTATLSPGYYCGGIHIANSVVDFEPGIYVIDGEGLIFDSTSVITGDDVSFYIAPTITGYSCPAGKQKGCAKKLWSVLMAGQTDVTLKAPTSGTYKGILLFQDPGADPTLLVDFDGQSNMSLEGVLYFPSSAVYYAGNNATNGAGWTMIIADTVTFAGNSYLGTPPSDAALPMAMMGGSGLVE